MSYPLDAAQAAHATAMIGEVQRRGLPQRAAVIVIETAIVESNIRIYANWNVPASLYIPHEGVGNDHASVGILQQQVPSWGTAADCMNPALAAGKFLAGAGDNPGLLTLPGYRFTDVGYPGATSWAQIPTGSAAQAVQVSAFPDRYQQLEADATAIVARFWAWHTPDTTSPVPLSEEDDMYTLYQIAKGTTNAGRVYAVRAGSKPWWLSPTDLATLVRFGLVANPSAAKPILQIELTRLTAAIERGAL